MATRIDSLGLPSLHWTADPFCPPRMPFEDDLLEISGILSLLCK